MSKENSLQDFGERVRSARKDQELNQSELADRVGISRTYLSQIEQGQAVNLSLRLAQKLSTLLGIDSPYEEEQKGETIPQSLKDLAEEDNLPEEDVRMLSKIVYRGKQPNSVQEWRILYRVIETTSKGGEDS